MVDYFRQRGLWIGCGREQGSGGGERGLLAIVKMDGRKTGMTRTTMFKDKEESEDNMLYAGEEWH